MAGDTGALAEVFWDRRSDETMQPSYRHLAALSQNSFFALADRRQLSALKRTSGPSLSRGGVAPQWDDGPLLKGSRRFGRWVFRRLPPIERAVNSCAASSWRRRPFRLLAVLRITQPGLTAESLREGLAK
jgi:hypothetical protein